MPIEIIVGLPHLRRGPILARSLAMQASLLISANALSRWTVNSGLREWAGWDTRALAVLPTGTELALDCGGFTAHMTYGGFPWTIEAYLDLVEAFRFRWFASFDYPVEPEIAADRDAVEDRISRTIAANRQTYASARHRGIHRLMLPVLQGRSYEDYARCADAPCGMIENAPVIGLGSMCRREIRGPAGIVAIVEQLDRLLPRGTGLHLFGVKGSALIYLKHLEHRIASIDSEAYGIAARPEPGESPRPIAWSQRTLRAGFTTSAGPHARQGGCCRSISAYRPRLPSSPIRGPTPLPTPAAKSAS